MVIVIVRWYIKTGREDDFRNLWINEMEPTIKEGLFREFFSKPIDTINDKYHTLDVESKHYTTFINVGIWDKVGDFDTAIGTFIPDRDKLDLAKHPEKYNKEIIEVFDFEFKLRERVVMAVENDRIGNWTLPDATLINRLLK